MGEQEKASKQASEMEREDGKEWREGDMDCNGEKRGRENI